MVTNSFFLRNEYFLGKRRVSYFWFDFFSRIFPSSPYLIICLRRQSGDILASTLVTYVCHPFPDTSPGPREAAVQLQVVHGAVGGNHLHADSGTVWCTRGQCLLMVLDGDDQVSKVKMTSDFFKTK